MKGRRDEDDALACTGSARGQRGAQSTAAAFAQITAARNDYEDRLNQEARVGQIDFGDNAGRWRRN